MARYDKYDPFNGGFRAFLAADWAPGAANASDPLNPANWNKVQPVSLNANGAVVFGSAGHTGVVGVCIVSDDKKAGDVVDVMTSGEIVEFNDGKQYVTAPTAGTEYYAPLATTTINTTATGTYLGYTVEPDRLVVRVARNGAST
jgi:hypothetical protein